MAEDAGTKQATGGYGGPQYAKGSWVPTRKWVAALVTSVAAVLVAWVEAGEWTTTVSVMAIGVAAQAVASYVTPNEKSPTGTGVRAAAK